jgi:hypothetical protein
MTRHEFFLKRLKMLNLYDGHSDYEGKIGCCVEQLSGILQRQAHSGMSEKITLNVFNELYSEWEAYGQVAPDDMFISMLTKNHNTFCHMKVCGCRDELDCPGCSCPKDNE